MRFVAPAHAHRALAGESPAPAWPPGRARRGARPPAPSRWIACRCHATIRCWPASTMTPGGRPAAAGRPGSGPCRACCGSASRAARRSSRSAARLPSPARRPGPAGDRAAPSPRSPRCRAPRSAGWRAAHSCPGAPPPHRAGVSPAVREGRSWCLRAVPPGPRGSVRGTPAMRAAPGSARRPATCRGAPGCRCRCASPRGSAAPAPSR